MEKAYVLDEGKQGIISLEQTINQLRDQVIHYWGKETPLCQLFSTSNSRYLYDTGTNKILKCTENEYELMQSLFTSRDAIEGLDIFIRSHNKEDSIAAIHALLEAYKVEHILKLSRIQSFALSHEPAAVLDKAYNDLSIMILEVTQDCNLRCGYCIYNDNHLQNRGHSLEYMTPEIAEKAIDHLQRCSGWRKEVSVGFYGGEPLAHFELVRKVVPYARRALANKEITFSLTSNGTFINKNIAKFLNREGFRVLISIDGPEEIHNLWRKDKIGRGSFKAAFNGLRLLAEEYGRSTKNIGLSMVYAPPYSRDKLGRIDEFISSIDWLPKEIQIVITYPHEGTVPHAYIGGCKTDDRNQSDFTLSRWVWEKFFVYYRKGATCDPITRSIVETKLARLVQRPILNNAVNTSQLNGCCYPGSRRIYVTSNGEMRLCERIGLSPSIGNISIGIFPEVIRDEYLSKYSSKSIADCSDCWLARLCPICYQQAYFNGDIDIIRKRQYCIAQRIGMVRDLSLYCQLKEIDEHGLDYLYKWEIK